MPDNYFLGGGVIRFLSHNIAKFFWQPSNTSNTSHLQEQFRELWHKDFLSKLKGVQLFYLNKETGNAILVFKISSSWIWLTWNSFVVSGFRREAVENCALLGCYAASSGKFSLTKLFRLLCEWRNRLRLGVSVFGTRERQNFLRCYKPSSREERPEREADISSVFSAETKPAWSCISLWAALRHSAYALGQCEINRMRYLRAAVTDRYKLYSWFQTFAVFWI